MTLTDSIPLIALTAFALGAAIGSLLTARQIQREVDRRPWVPPRWERRIDGGYEYDGGNRIVYPAAGIDPDSLIMMPLHPSGVNTWDFEGRTPR